ncbi:Lysosomal-trafficking regulator [Orchesella cincta]|uniref:Lysosomal-trafficking regulator n=1 Tax=Orchesella cincta TaxID=48709 RepID=A0A1D2NMZ0_ORCCI|nr:Lysosomal-trafficking regulator [Orchesella cincta]
MDPNRFKSLEDQIEIEGGTLTVYNDNGGSSSSTSVYSTAEEDHFDSESPPDIDTEGVHEPLLTSTRTWVTGSKEGVGTDETDNSWSSARTQNNISASISSSTNSSAKLTNQIQNIHTKNGARDRDESFNSSDDSTTTEIVETVARNNSTSFQIGEVSFTRQSDSSTDLPTTLSESESGNNIAASLLLPEGRPISVVQLQDVFDRFKSSDNSFDYYADLIDLLGSAQSRNDFQWALHQMGGISALIFLFARVVEICRDDEIQSKALCLVLTQLKNHSKATDVLSRVYYNLIRFILNSERSTFGFKTFLVLINHCLNQRGHRLLDYELLDTCLLTSWRILLRNRCTDADAPTGRRSLFECLLTVILDLIVEKNSHRDLNMNLLKSKFFGEVLLSTCYNAIFEVNNYQPTPGTSSGANSNPAPSLSSVDAIRITVLIKSILFELMTPPDAFIGVCLVKYGLYPLLPKELPPLPQKESAFFTFQNQQFNNATEALEDVSENSTNHSSLSSTRSKITKNMMEFEGEDEIPEMVSVSNEDIPEIVGRTLIKQKVYNKETFESTQLDGFRETFQESLTEAVMTILLNTLAIIPDGAFYSVLRSHLTPHIFVAYCSHPSFQIKKLAIKLLSAYLSRVKNACISEFLTARGFFLTSMYIQDCPELSSLIGIICQGYGPVSYPLILSLLHTNAAVNTILEWVQEDEAGVIPGLMSMGFIPSVLNLCKPGSGGGTLTRGLNDLLSRVIKFCAVSPKEDPWKVLLCPALESLPQGNHLSGRIFQEATEYLKVYSGRELKKGDAGGRLIWLLERGTVSRFGNQFDKWLLNVFMVHFMEMDDEQETDVWKTFVKKHKKRLMYLLGVCLCRILAPNRGDLHFKQLTLRILLGCPNVKTWLPKVIRIDEQIERCFTAFFRMFLSEADKRSCPKVENVSSDGMGLTSPSFQTLISDNSAIRLVAVSKGNAADGANQTSLEGQQQNSMQPGFNMTDKLVRTKLEEILISVGLLSPMNSFSTYSADFKNFKLLLETPPIYGVSYYELRQCLASVERMRQQLQKSLNGSATSFMSSLGMDTIVKDFSLERGVNKQNVSAVIQKNNCCNTAYFDGVYDMVSNLAVDMLDNVTRTRTIQEIELVRRLSLKEDDIIARNGLWKLVERMTHPTAPWHFAASYPKFWALDQSEGPGRVRLRLKREQLKIHSRFVMPNYRDTGDVLQPLEYLLSEKLEEQTILPKTTSGIQFMRFCTRIIPGEELPGEIILNSETLHFIPDAQNGIQECIQRIDVPLTSIIHILKRRYTLEDRAAELFVESRSYMFVFRGNKDREEFVKLISVKHSANSLNSSLMDSSLPSMTAQWTKGQISNFEYLMYLNTAAGRTYCDLMQYPVFPFVLAKYDCPTVDLNAVQSYRDLKKPMAIQDPSKEEHFISTYNYLKRECDSPPFHYGSHYSNSGIVLHFLIRLPPYTQHFLKYQDGSFDIPDRSFHSIDTTWKLASRESNTDFKEAIPEFFYLPEFLKNIQRFDFGKRQNGMRVDDVTLPPWANGNARLFTLVNRQALESNQVRKFLSDWIDLIFGYKQTGKAAIQAMNVFHPSTYEGFEVDGVGDELLRKARKAMVSTYGQTPKKLFPYPHPRSAISPIEDCEMMVTDTVSGIRWGRFIGSPLCTELEVNNTRTYEDSMSLFETQTRIVFWPENTIIIGDKIVGKWDASGIRIKSNIVYLCIGDEITVCVTTDNSIWVGHQSGLITVLKLTSELDKVEQKFELVGHYQAIKCIDLNQDFSTAISCSGENYALVWDMNRLRFNNVIRRPESIDEVYSSRSTGDVVLLNATNNIITLTTINGFEVASIQPDDRIECVCLSNLDPGRNVNLIAVGCDYGMLRFYSTWDLKFVNEIKVVPLATLAIKKVRYSKNGERLYCLSSTGEISISAALQLSDSKR